MLEFERDKSDIHLLYRIPRTLRMPMYRIPRNFQPIPLFSSISTGCGSVTTIQVICTSPQSANFDLTLLELRNVTDITDTCVKRLEGCGKKCRRPSSFVKQSSSWVNSNNFYEVLSLNKLYLMELSAFPLRSRHSSQFHSI